MPVQVVTAKRNWTPRLGLVVRVIVSVALLAVVLGKLPDTGFAVRFAPEAAPLAILSLGILLLQGVAAARRWQLIGLLCGPPLTFGTFWRFAVIGQLFSQALPTAIGGDAIRAWLHHRAGATLAHATYATIADRLFGLLGLLAVIAGTLPALPGIVRDPLARGAIWTTAAAAGAGFVAALLLAGPLGRWMDRLPAGPWARGLARTVWRPLTRVGSGLSIVGLSLVTHSASILSAWCLARSVGVELGVLHFAVLVPPTLLVSMIPLTVAGWGVREVMLVTLLGAQGVPADRAFMLSVMIGLGTAAVSLPGAVFWLAGGRSCRQERTPAPGLRA